jgi:hypothetical protein
MASTFIPLMDLREASVPDFWCQPDDHIWVETGRSGRWVDVQCVKCDKTSDNWSI